MYLSLSLYLSVPSYFSLSLPFCWSGHVFSWSPPVLQGFRFGLEGWKSLNPAQWMKQSVIEWVNDQGRSRAARAAKNIRIKWNNMNRILPSALSMMPPYLCWITKYWPFHPTHKIELILAFNHYIKMWLRQHPTIVKTIFSYKMTQINTMKVL